MRQHSIFGALGRLIERNHVKALTVMLFALSVLGGCGSGDRFPGTEEQQAPDPLVADVPLFYIERPLRYDDTATDTIEPDDLLDPLTFHGEARLYMRVRADASAPSVDLSARAFEGNVDVRDLAVSPDGKKIAFALRAPQLENVDEDEQPTWNLWQYDIDTDQLQRLIIDDNQAEKGHDITPQYLPDGRIIFASTRQQKSREILSDEFKPQFSHPAEDGRQPALNLHVLNLETQKIEQVTFNQSHDFYPTVLPSGKVVFTRWERAANNNALSLYEMNPDGTQLQLLYGHHSQGNGVNQTRFVRSNVLEDGDLFVLIRPDNTPFYGGDFVRIDTKNFTDDLQPVYAGTSSGPAQSSITGKSIITTGELSTGGYFSAFFPMADHTDRAVVSWSRCRLVIGDTTQTCIDANINNPDATIAPIAYGIWTFDYQNNTQIPIIAARPGVVYTDVVLGAPRLEATYLPPKKKLAELIYDGKEDAAIHIRNVFDFDGTHHGFGALTPAYLKIIKAVSEPPRDTEGANFSSRDNAGGARMREIVGYAPIALDGSVKVKVPSDVALSLSIVDANGKALRYNGTSGELLRHNNWITLRPGEVMECKGCHTQGSTAPHGRYNAQAPSTNSASVTIAQANAATGIPELSHNLINHPALDYSTDPALGTNPSDRTCLLNQRYSGGCPTIINYPDHIQTIWERERDDDGADITCTSCHNSGYMKDPNNSTDNPNSEIGRLPPTQLELTNEAENGIRYRSYFELFSGGRPFQVVVTDPMTNNTNLVDCSLVTTPVLNALNEPVLDTNGNPITTNACPDGGATVAPSLSTNGAFASARFFRVFESSDPDVATHSGYLEPFELRMIAEWLDIGGQYYNSHFDAPSN